MMFLSVRVAMVLGVFGLVVEPVAAGPLIVSSGIARVFNSCTQKNLAALTFVCPLTFELGFTSDLCQLNRMMGHLIIQERL